MNIYQLVLPNDVIIQYKVNWDLVLGKGKLKLANMDVLYYPEVNELYFKCSINKITITLKQVVEELKKYKVSNHQ